MRIDLHTHSAVSDGTQSPTVLVRHAAEVGLDVMALTDHDTAESWAEAQAAADDVALTLVPGIEVSCRYAGEGVHLLAYFPDPTHAGFDRELDKILDGRNSRLPATLERLRGEGIDIDIRDVRRVAQDAAAMGRPHVADALVALGVVKDRDEAFARYLAPGKPAYVDRYAADLVAMIRLITDAGGVSVIAHPWARHAHTALDVAGLESLRAEGLAGVEVDHQDHDVATREELRGIARDLNLVATGSSDYHGTGKVDHELGCNTTDPEQYGRLLELARAAAVASGRSTPEVPVG